MATARCSAPACICEDIEAAAGIDEVSAPVSAIAWAPRNGQHAERLAVARGAAVRLLEIQSNVEHQDTYAGAISATQVRGFLVRCDKRRGIEPMIGLALRQRCCWRY